jgi:hypothetical protein
MGRWIRVDVTRQQHPRAMEAGGWGMVVAQAVWEICKAHDKHGIMPAHYWKEEFLTRWTNFDSERGGITGIRKGMKQALDAGLLERAADGSIKIHDWQQYQVDPRIGNKKTDDNKNNNLKETKPVSSSVTPTDTIPKPCDTEKSIRQDRTRHNNTKNKIVPDASPSEPGPVPFVFDYDTNKWNRRPTSEELSRWKASYPSVDPVKEMVKAVDWLIVNKNTKKGRKKHFDRFLINWLNRAQVEADRRGY